HSLSNNFSCRTYYSRIGSPRLPSLARKASECFLPNRKHPHARDPQRNMRKTTLTIGEVGLIAATRGMLGAGVALLLAGKMDSDKRRKVGVPLALIGALSTI